MRTNPILKTIMEKQNVKIEVADPTTLGLFGLAIITLVASTQKLGLTDGYSMLLPWALFLGGLAQIVASIFDFKHSNLFGATAFSAYGFFWIGMGMSWLIKMGCLGETLHANGDGSQLGFVFIGYLLLSVVLTVSALKMSKAMFWLMSLICMLFLSLAVASFCSNPFWGMAAGAVELAISLLAFYVLAAKYLNSYFGKTMLPVGAAYCNGL